MVMASSVNLGEQLESFIDQAVKAGRYGSRSEVLREGVRLVQEREARLARFDAEIMKAIASSERGESIPLDQAFEELEDYVRELGAVSGHKDAA
jgi:antitoxin ParD1/3/4